MLVKNWKQMWKSYSVILPALITAILVVVDSTVANDLLPEQWLPIVVFISGFLGRVVKQYNLGGKK